MDTIAGRLKHVAQQKRISQVAIAKAIGRNHVTMNRWLNNSREIPAEDLRKIIVLLKCDPVWVLMGDEYANNNDIGRANGSKGKQVLLEKFLGILEKL
jgi:transcriptional regulator with XRE-family HTH domain